MTTLAQIRQEYPQYRDMTDAQIADRLYERHYSDMPRAEFNLKIGYSPQGWGGYAGGLARQAAQGLTFGFADEAEAGARSLFGSRSYSDIVGDIRRGNEEFSRDNPIASTAANIGGGIVPFVAGPAAGLASWAARGGSALGRVGRSATLGTGAGAVSGLGAGEGGVGERLPSAVQGAAVGGAIGAAAPPVAGAIGWGLRQAGNITSPALARFGGSLRRSAPEEPFPPPPSGRTSAPIEGATFVDDAQGLAAGSGAEAQADQILANELLRSGRSIDDVRAVLAARNRARTFGEGSEAASATTLADVVPGWQRSLGAATRASTEVGETADRFFAARQTGHTPAGGRPLHEGAGIPTRAPMSPPLTGAQAERTLGSSFGTAANRLVPMGARERVSDAMRRALRIRDEAQHGHQTSAYRTLKAIEKEGKEASDKAYAAFRLAQAGYDIRPHIQGAIDAVTARIANPETARTEARLLQRALAEFYRTVPGSKAPQLVRTADAFDSAKKALDDLIREQGPNGQRILSSVRDDLVAAVDGITDRNIGGLYSAARGVYHDNRRLQEAYQAGREAAKEGAEVGADTYRALPGAETGAGASYKKAFRLGLWESYDARMSRLKPTDDVTNLFKQRDLELLEAVIPRTRTEGGRPTGAYGDRPERFGRFLEAERGMVGTQRATRGGSQTAERMRDDEARDVAHQIVEGFRNLGTFGIDLVARTLNRMFGYQADTSQAIATRLLSADPAVIERTLANIEMRMGKNRFELFARALQDLQTRAGAGFGAAAGGMAGGQQPGPVAI